MHYTSGLFVSIFFFGGSAFIAFFKICHFSLTMINFPHGSLSIAFIFFTFIIKNNLSFFQFIVHAIYDDRF